MNFAQISAKPGRVAILVVGVLIIIPLLQFVGVDSGMPRLAR